ncbi:hypothetical protein ACNKHX_12985 [Shigella flexneri]
MRCWNVKARFIPDSIGRKGILDGRCVLNAFNKNVLGRPLRFALNAIRDGKPVANWKTTA